MSYPITNEILQLSLDAIKTICDVLNAKASEIKEIEVLKKGMTNRSFLFAYDGKKYIMRIPGEGTEKLINRESEAEVYTALSGKGITDETLFINPKNGFKISRFIDNARVCDKNNKGDIKKCMKKLRAFHEATYKTNYDFDLFGQIEFYEKLRGKKSCYSDYDETKNAVFSLQNFINAHKAKKTLCHIDSVPDNFLFYKDENGTENLRLIDWEYASMQDPHLDIAMFAVYSMYDYEKICELISAYFDGTEDDATVTKIYCYIATAGLLWSNWCEYKKMLGVEFGEYALAQYKFAKDYSKIALEKIRGEDNYGFN